jgi:predicted lipoprotein
MKNRVIDFRWYGKALSNLSLQTVLRGILFASWIARVFKVTLITSKQEPKPTII